MSKKTLLITAFFVLLAAHAVALWLLNDRPPDHDPAVLSGFRGNLISGFFGGLLFLLFGLYLNDGLERLQVETHRLTKQAAKFEEQRRQHARFIEFLRAETYHDARFPNLKTRLEPLGLEYTLEPVRDENTGEPRRKVTEMDTSYVVRVCGPSHEEIREPQSLAEYDTAPIRTGEYYFCRFYSDGWHMGQDVSGFDEWHSFYLSGKVGPLEHGGSANEFVGATHVPAEWEPLCRFLVKEDGTLMAGSGGAYPVEVYRARGQLFVRFHESPPKALHREPDPSGGAERLVIEDMAGYFPGPARESFLSVLSQQLRRAEQRFS